MGSMSVATLAPRTEPALDALGRLETLCDRGSLELIRAEVLSGSMGEKARPGDGVLAGAGVVRDALGEDVSADQLGGTRVHERNGVCHFVAPTGSGAAYLARELLGYLPRHRDARPPVLPARPPLGYDPSSPVPSDPR